MTLNVTVATKHRIYQSSDFLVVIEKPYEVVAREAVKIVEFHYEGFFGLIAYTGVARWPRKTGRDTADRIAEWVIGHDKLEHNELLEIVRRSGDHFLEKVHRSYGFRPAHTFTVAAFVHGVSTISLVSNFEDVSGQEDDAVQSRLRISTRAFRGQPFTVSTGRRRAVSRQLRRQVERMVARNPKDAQVGDELRRLNEMAADSPRAARTVSRECSVYMLDSTGSGTHTITPGPTIDPITITFGIQLPRKDEIAQMVGRDPKTMQLRQAAFGSSSATDEQPSSPD
jgi:hypothetical protein